MNLLGNIIWILCGGLVSAISWWIAGFMWCITIVGIPIGLQCFKLSALSLDPFGKEVIDEGGAVSCLLNIVWFFLSGIELALCNFLLGCLLCITIIGIPFGLQFFKLAKLSLFPFGKSVVSVN